MNCDMKHNGFMKKVDAPADAAAASAVPLGCMQLVSCKGSSCARPSGACSLRLWSYGMHHVLE